MIFGGVAFTILLVIDIYFMVHPKEEESKIQWHLKHGYVDYLD